MSAFEVRDEEIFQQCATKNIINGFLQKPIRLIDLIYEVKNQIGIGFNRQNSRKF